MEAPSIPNYYREEILDMKPELVPLFLSVLGLPAGSNERQRILERLERLDKIRPDIPTYYREEILDMKPELVPVFLNVLGITPGGNERQRILEELERRSKIRPVAVRYLSGIHQVDYITGTYAGVTRKFYLFHDVHTTKGECSPDLMGTVKVNDWLLQKLSQPHGTKFIDFFLEATPPPPIKEEFAEKFFPEPKSRASMFRLRRENKYHEEQGPIVNLNEDLKACYSHHLFAECPYSDVRIHFADPRKFSYIASVYSSDKSFRFLWDFFDTDNFDKSYYISYMLEKYIDRPDSKFYKEWLKTPFASEWKLMTIRILGIVYDYSIQKIRTIKDIFNHFKYLRHKYGARSKTFYNIGTEDTEEFNTLFSLPIVRNVVIELTAVLQDVYAIARMFKRFSGEPEYAENIVYYAGRNHSKIVNQFLLGVLGFKLQYQAKAISSVNFQCVDIQNLPWTF